jgi:hypothetical protein
MKHGTLIDRNLKYEMMFMYKNDKDNIDAVKTGCLYFKVKIV